MDRHSFNVGRVPFKAVRHLPGVGKNLHDHLQVSATCQHHVSALLPRSLAQVCAVRRTTCQHFSPGPDRALHHVSARLPRLWPAAPARCAQRPAGADGAQRVLRVPHPARPPPGPGRVPHQLPHGQRRGAAPPAPAHCRVSILPFCACAYPPCVSTFAGALARSPSAPAGCVHVHHMACAEAWRRCRARVLHESQLPCTEAPGAGRHPTPESCSFTLSVSRRFAPESKPTFGLNPSFTKGQTGFRQSDKLKVACPLTKSLILGCANLPDGVRASTLELARPSAGAVPAGLAHDGLAVARRTRGPPHHGPHTGPRLCPHTGAHRPVQDWWSKTTMG